LNIKTAAIGLAPRAGFAIRIRLAPDPLMSRAAFLRRHDGVDLDQRILPGAEARLTVRKIEKPVCTIVAFPFRFTCRSYGRAKVGAIFRGAVVFIKIRQGPREATVVRLKSGM
jgi:hypothetical protein